MRRMLATLAVFALVGVGCSDDGGEDADVGDGDATTTAPDDSAATTTAPPDDGEPATTTAAPDEPLPASFRGVTETSIKVGVAVPDFDALQAAGIGNYQGDADIAFQAFFDQINEAGGVGGRVVEPVYVGFDFVRSETQDEACARFVDDEEVFIVLYGLLGDSNLCLTDLNDTMVMTRSFQTTDLRDASGDTLWLQLNARDDEKTKILAQVLADSGRLDGRTIGIFAAAGDNDGFEAQVLQEELTTLGFDSQIQLASVPFSDPIASTTELERIGERFRTDGVDFVIELQGGGNTPTIWAGIGYDPDSAHKNLGAIVDAQDDRSTLDGAVGVGEINEQGIIDDADFQANCMDVVRDANPELADEMAFLPDGDQQAAGEPNWVNPVMIACDQTRLFAAIAELAGPDLTNDSFKAALDDLGEFDLYGYGQASFRSADKWDGLDEFYLQEYDAAADAISLIGDPILVDR